MKLWVDTKWLAVCMKVSTSIFWLWNASIQEASIFIIGTAKLTFWNIYSKLIVNIIIQLFLFYFLLFCLEIYLGMADKLCHMTNDQQKTDHA